MRNCIQRFCSAAFFLMATLAPALEARALELGHFLPDRFSHDWISYETIGRDLPYFYDLPTALDAARRGTNTPFATWLALGLQHYAAKDFAPAVECLRAAQAATNAPSRPLRHLLAKTLALNQEPDLARAQWETLAQEAPDDLEAWWQWGFQCLALRDLSGAERCFRHLREVAPDDPSIQHMLAMVSWMQGNGTVAERQLIQTTRRPGSLPLTSLALAAMQAMQEADPEAIGWLRRALRELPRSERYAWTQNAAFAGVRSRRPDLWQGLQTEFNLSPTSSGADTGRAARPDSEPKVLDISYQSTIRLKSLDGSAGPSQPMQDQPSENVPELPPMGLNAEYLPVFPATSGPPAAPVSP